MTSELKKARRVLAQLERRLLLVRRGAGISEVGGQLWMEAERWERELTAQVKRQELEVRRLALTGPWVVWRSSFGGWWVQSTSEDARLITGRNCEERAIAWAERKNRKEGGI
jgi:hypothetical protein